MAVMAINKSGEASKNEIDTKAQAKTKSVKKDIDKKELRRTNISNNSKKAKKERSVNNIEPPKKYFIKSKITVSYLRNGMLLTQSKMVQDIFYATIYEVADIENLIRPRHYKFTIGNNELLTEENGAGFTMEILYITEI